MLPTEKVREIERFDPQGEDALTMYLNTDPSQAPGRNMRAQLRDVLRPILEALGGDTAATSRLETAFDAALAEAELMECTPRALALFSCPPRSFAGAVALPDPVAESAHWGPELYLRPLLAALDEHETTLAVLVDRERARLFRVFMGEIEETRDIEGGERRHAATGGAQRRAPGSGSGWQVRMGYGESNIQRHDRELLHRHVEDVLAALEAEVRAAPADRILLGGAPEALATLRLLLPKRLRGRVHNGLRAPIDAPTSRVLAEVIELQRGVEREAELHLLEMLTEKDAAHAVFGVAPVCEAVAEGRVRMLAYAEQASVSGVECDACGWMMPGPANGDCPRCQGTLRERPDLVERMVSLVLHAGGRVEEVRGAAAERLSQREGVAALLRYSSVRTEATV